MQTGKQHRLSRFYYPNSRRGLIVPIDHGLTLGPIDGIGSVDQIAQWIHHSSITGVICHKGMAEKLVPMGVLSGKGLMIHLNGQSALGENPDNKIALTHLESALSLGADAVSLQVNFTAENVGPNLSAIGNIVDEANRYGLPVLAMVYDKVTTNSQLQIERMRQFIRISLELGISMVKIAFQPNLNKILKDISNDTAIFVAGGPVLDEGNFLNQVSESIAYGSQGICVGRNIFQRPNPVQLLSDIQSRLIESANSVNELSLKEIRYGIH
jgi:fructose-bisphosphate aldolase, class I